MDLLRTMRIFESVAEGMSYTSAARSLNLSTGAVSRAVTDLEAHLSTRLFHRTTRRITLTPAGKQYLDRCRSILASLGDAEAEARSIHVSPAGCLRIQASRLLAEHYLIPAAKTYMERYPSVRIGLTFSDAPTGLLNDGFDLAVVATEALPDSSLISTQLGTTCSVMCAAPHYLKTHGAIRTTADLSAHPYVCLSAGWLNSVELSPYGPDGREKLVVEPKLCINSLSSLAGALELGSGVGLLPLRTALDAFREGRLEHVLPGCQFDRTNIYALFASKPFLDAKVRTWLDHLKAIFAKADAGQSIIAEREKTLAVA
jgi:DNA-binding transcriptional LysR family regulator